MEPVIVTTLTGTLGPGTQERERVYVDIGWGDARKHRQVVTASDGRQVHLKLPRGAFLDDGAIVHDDGSTVIVVRRPAEPAITVGFADNSGADGARRMLLLGYLLGNQHAPLDVSHDRVATPLMTSPEAAQAVLESLHITGRVAPTSLANEGWTNTSADHHHSHHHHDHGNDDD